MGGVSMAMSGFICHDDYYDRIKRLSNEEVGSLFRNLMLYHAKRYDEMQDFVDAEGVAFDFIANDIDRMEEKYNTTCETNRQNGMKGGRPKKQTEPEETDKNPIKPTETDKNPTKPYKDKDKYKYKYKEQDKESSSFMDDSTAATIQHEHDRVFTAAEDAGFKMSNTVRARLIALYADNGLEKMLTGFNECATHGAPTIAYLEAVLKGTGKKKPQMKVLPAQQYDQRDYSGVQAELMAEQDREMEEYMSKESG
jgi:hypothetical protein